MGVASSKIHTLVHGTSIEGFKSIMIMERVLDQVDKANLKILLTGQGGIGRALGQFDDLRRLLDEAQGVYLRLDTTTSPLDLLKEPGDVFLLFHPDLLNQYKPWVINTEENFGFMIDVHGVLGTAEYGSGEPGTSWVNFIPPERIREVSNRSELLIPNSINLDNLVAVAFKNEEVLNKVQGIYKGPTVILKNTLQ